MKKRENLIALPACARPSPRYPRNASTEGTESQAARLNVYDWKTAKGYPVIDCERESSSIDSLFFACIGRTLSNATITELSALIQNLITLGATANRPCRRLVPKEDTLPVQLDPFDVLGVDRNTSMEEITQAFESLSKERHPTLGGELWIYQATLDAFHEIKAAPAKGKPLPQDTPVDERARTAVNRVLKEQLPLQNETTYFILVNVLDIFLTYLLLVVGAVESNPIANFFLERWGFSGMIAYKMVMVAFVCVLAQIVARRNLPRARMLLWLGCLIVGAVVLYSVRLLVGQIL